MRRPYFANALIDVALPGELVVTMPCERRADGKLLLFPMPEVSPAMPGMRGPRRPANVTLLNATWFVNDALASTLPVRCPSQQAAQRLADVWLDAVHHESVDPSIGDQVESWCWWFTQTHPENGQFAPLHDRPRVHQANTADESIARTVRDALAIVAADAGEPVAQTDIMPMISDNAPGEAQKTEESA